MSLIAVILILAVIGAIVWAVTTYIPMPRVVKGAIYVVALIVVLLWLLSLFGVGMPAFKVGD